jgi:Cof subfamily protein (haloacid dehalogenase superfamily)
MSIKLIAMDLDGTLLDSEKMISARNLAAIEAAKRQGVYVTVATGRMFLSAAYFGRAMGANAPLICCNGGMVQQMDAAEPVFERQFPSETVRELLDLCHARDWYVQWYIGKDIYAEDFRQEYFYAYRTVRDFKLIEVGDAYASHTEHVIQCVARDLQGRVPEIVAEINERFAGRVCPQQNTGQSVDLTPPHVDKALGVSALAARLGLSADEVMVCGDADNDLPMLRWAGTAVVMANGLPQAKELATYQAASNDDDGVGRAIEELVL